MEKQGQTEMTPQTLEYMQKHNSSTSTGFAGRSVHQSQKGNQPDFSAMTAEQIENFIDSQDERSSRMADRGKQDDEDDECE